MPADARKVTPEDLLPDAEYARVRKERRAALLPLKRLRRIELGPICTFIFESYETMLFQIQEMLLTERGGAAQVPDELAAYNPLIPQGQELVATVMFEIDDPVRREQTLARGIVDFRPSEENIAMPIKGQKLPTKLARPGIIRLQCDAGHTWMSAWIHVFREPTFAVTDERGHFSIPNVAPGEYTIEYWHEPLDGVGAGITKTAHLIVGGKPVHADARLKL